MICPKKQIPSSDFSNISRNVCVQLSDKEAGSFGINEKSFILLQDRAWMDNPVVQKFLKEIPSLIEKNNEADRQNFCTRAREEGMVVELCPAAEPPECCIIFRCYFRFNDVPFPK